jgi:hypothetical protein
MSIKSAMRELLRKAKNMLARLSPRKVRSSAPAPGAVTFDYYISTTGSDSNPGTLAEPWAITAIESKGSLLVSKRVGLLSGTYYLADYWTLGSSQGVGAYINMFYGGTAEAPTVIESVVPRGAILTPEATGGTLEGNNYACLWVDDDADYVELRGIRFTRSGAIGVWVMGSYNLIEDCQFDDFDGSRIGIDGGSNPGAIRHRNFGRFSTIRNCKFFDLFTGSPSTIQSAVGPVYDYQDIVIEYCSFSTCVPFYPKRNTGNFTFRYNFVYDTTEYSGSEAILLSFDVSDHLRYDDSAGTFPDYGRTSNKCHNNLFVVENTRLSYDSYQTGQWANDVEFYNNTVVLNASLQEGSGFWRRGNDSGDIDNGKTPPADIPVTWDWYNNIFYAGAGVNIQAGWMYTRDAYGFPDLAGAWDYNGYNTFKYAMLDGATLTEYTTIGSFQAIGLDTNSIVDADPEFANLGGSTAADYQLEGTSPFKSAGHVGGVSGGATVDMGAWGGLSPPTQIGASF